MWMRGGLITVPFYLVHALSLQMPTASRNTHTGCRDILSRANHTFGRLPFEMCTGRMGRANRKPLGATTFCSPKIAWNWWRCLKNPRTYQRPPRCLFYLLFLVYHQEDTRHLNANAIYNYVALNWGHSRSTPSIHTFAHSHQFYINRLHFSHIYKCYAGQTPAPATTTSRFGERTFGVRSQS